LLYLTFLLSLMHRFRANRVPALDGLRGIAILLVLSHHQLIPYSLPGGFLSVDLFFVLSGFLITSLLLQEFDATETVSLKNFYLRRALRLGPALVLYLFASLAVIYYLDPNQFKGELRLVGLALAYSTNWRLAFGWDQSLDPTAITWSLSIEEQFYLVWPMLLVLCLTAGVKRRQLSIGLVVIILAILLHRSYLWSGGAEHSRLYYGTDTRADAPLMGCLVALVPVWKLGATTRQILRLANIAAVACLAYLVCKTHFTDAFIYRWGYTAIAAICGVIVLTSAVEESTLLSKLFGLRVFQWFGKVSYGLYLWHWLLLKTTTFYFWVGPTLDPWARFAAAVLISAVSFYLIEAPFNRLKTQFSFNSRSLNRTPRARKAHQFQPDKAPTPVLVQPTEQNV
jgi:peptidoglycan/LPS O-acetylase OafA/YrhL